MQPIESKAIELMERVMDVLREQDGAYYDSVITSVDWDDESPALFFNITAISHKHPKAEVRCHWAGVIEFLESGLLPVAECLRLHNQVASIKHVLKEGE